MLPRTRVKICGITSTGDAQLAVASGADAIGLVFHRGSPRYVSVENAARIVQALPPFVTAVGLFVDEDPDKIEEVIARAGVHLLQFHGDEPPEDCAAFGRPWIKAARVFDGLNLDAFAARYEAAQALLLDAWSAEAPGGTGQTFDWSRIPEHLYARTILAGGLHAGNVAEAIRRVRPYAVDVSSGVEAAPGAKDSHKMSEFMAAVRGTDQEIRA